ncbi:hypothetical protein EUX98_g788 [Antrodiella citrinella]|uniref:Protein saf1 n=1 Tax=Antrodiella citrinella TaxID=2447956 RepID=A0A4S4N4Q1_9APHY|nr:hypothetical protein EUX98_g788 [Antrodiella citrinella]
MAKGKTVNPADAHHLEEDIEKLEGNSDISPADASRLQELKEELAKITKKKEDYVTEHPEHRKLVFRSKRNDSTQESEPRPEPKSRKLFNKNGLPRHPERSIYYDPVMNPYGVPPPGMPYVERALRPEEVDSDQDDMQGDSDDGIAMPVGPPPGRSDDNDEDSDDDIPMPDGPPPPKYGDPSAVSIAATVSAAPQLRDLKKESTAFVPSTLKRKKAGTAPAASQLNAAPSVGLADESDSVSTAPRPNLLSTLRGQLGTGAPTVTPSQKKPKPGDDYTKFMDEMGDILGPTS